MASLSLLAGRPVVVFTKRNETLKKRLFLHIMVKILLLLMILCVTFTKHKKSLKKLCVTVNDVSIS